MPLAPGSKLGPYEIVAALGQGGMGEVYRAMDSKLNRAVAIKVMQSSLVQNPARLARFEREARLLASLNHPNIATIYGLEESPEGKAIAMELVEGATLHSPQPLQKALGIAVQIAAALEAAHDKGIIHRDLKPANIMITSQGLVKVLDFGLAAVEQPFTEIAGNPSDSPTLSMTATQGGVIMGTAGYMSPEQASGTAVDKRSDIWSFGVVLFEILVGTPLFTGETFTHTLAQVLHAPIDLNKLPSEMPGEISALLRRCLNRDPNKRLRDIGDARIAIEETLSAPENDTTAAAARRHATMPWALMVASLTALAFLALVHFREKPPASPVLSFSLPLPPNLKPGTFALSPDGKWLAIHNASESGFQIWLRALSSPQFQPLPGTEFGFSPFWSADSKSVGFFAARGKLEIVSADGGPPKPLCEGTGVAGGGGTWNRFGVILFGSPAGPLRRVNASGGPCIAVTRAEGMSVHQFPEFLPDGKHFVFTISGGDETSQGIYVASLDDPAPRRILSDISGAVFAPSLIVKDYGYLLFARGNSLMAQPFNPETRQLAGDVFPTGAEVSLGGSGASGELQLLASISSDGTLAYRHSPRYETAQLTWMGRFGKDRGTVGPMVQGQIHVALSPDGKTAATYRNNEIWLTDLRRAVELRFTPAELRASPPVWSPDGTLIAFGAGKDLYVKDARGGSKEQVIFEDGNVKRPSAWSRDGRYLIYTVDYTGDSKYGWHIWYLEDPLNRSGKRKAVPLANSEGNSQGQLSPDGRWLAYSAVDPHGGSIYVRQFPSGVGRWKISGNENVNVEPRWRNDGKELFYLEGMAPMRRVMVVSVRDDPRGGFEAGHPRNLFEFSGTSHVPSLNNFFYDVSADGQVFVANVEAAENQAAVNVFTNWEKAALGNR